MIIWIDAQLSPHIASFISAEFPEVRAQAVRELGLHHAKDIEIFESARKAGVVIMTKDRDFLLLLYKNGPPPQVLWVTAGNTSNQYLKQLLKKTLPKALELLKQDEPIVEISSP